MEYSKALGYDNTYLLSTTIEGEAVIVVKRLGQLAKRIVLGEEEVALLCAVSLPEESQSLL